MKKKGKVLLVDDNRGNLLLLEKALSFDYHLKKCQNGEDALIIDDHFCPDVVLLDIIMPGISGYEVCQKMREMSFFAKTKIIMLSALKETEERIEAYNAGADDYLIKPFHSEELKAKLKVFSSLRRLEEINSMKDDLLAHVAHEINTPLNYIIPTMGMVIADKSLSLESRELLNVAQEGAIQLKSLFDKATQLFEMKYGDWQCSLNKVLFSEIINSACSNLEHEKAAAEINFKKSFQGDFYINGDKSSLQYAMMAILENACNASQKQSIVEVTMSSKQSDLIIQVFDQGCGFEETFLEQAADVFADANVAEHSTGNGLSLAISNEIILKHGGFISLANNEQLGACVTLSLPLLDTQTSA